ncbi:MAG: hypothetical protein ACO1OG_03915, partial [Devosia sp.]
MEDLTIRADLRSVQGSYSSRVTVFRMIASIGSYIVAPMQPTSCRHVCGRRGKMSNDTIEDEDFYEAVR